MEAKGLQGPVVVATECVNAWLGKKKAVERITPERRTDKHELESIRDRAKGSTLPSIFIIAWRLGFLCRNNVLIGDENCMIGFYLYDMGSGRQPIKAERSKLPIHTSI
jgi:hypothetical protein